MGPRGGLIFCQPEYAEMIDKAVFPYCQGGSLMNVIAAKAICAEEAQTPKYREYIKNVISNCAAMAKKFQDLGYNIISGGTDNHLFLLDLRGTGVSGKELQDACDQKGITLNKNAIPNDPLPPSQASGVRIGTAAMTTKGFMENDFMRVAEDIDKIIKDLQAKKFEETKETKETTIKYDLKTLNLLGFDIDTNIYQDIEVWENVTVYVSKNLSNGEISLSWSRQPNTKNIFNINNLDPTIDSDYNENTIEE